jgi:hypothetical protein
VDGGERQRVQRAAPRRRRRARFMRAGELHADRGSNEVWLAVATGQEMYTPRCEPRRQRQFAEGQSGPFSPVLRLQFTDGLRFTAGLT